MRLALKGFPEVRVAGMASCELCGKTTELYRALVEGTELSVCEACSMYGRVLGRAKVIDEKREKKVSAPAEKEIIEIIVPDFSERIRKKRQALGLKQDEFGKLISEKESVVHKLETGGIKPSLETARKLEKILKIKLVEILEEEGALAKRGGSDQFTFGDAARIRKR